ncbi:hypothetical protein GLOIN_2v1763419 [Rhizophagus clarus]|uniref:Uncharacterized protein n=1 Tax=Rhizophagus clarus TaxID=94130 RepID=A0A8H3QVT1_9GLOM|nr:hypothetical protein GLOIN_2v1763419 [Rhizophagus clarus]
MPTVIVNVEYLFKSVFGWEGLPADENINVDEFYQDVVICKIRRELWNKNITAYFSLTKISEKEKIGLKCDVWETAKNYEKYITFKLKDNDYSNESTTKTKNAFELMRIASTFNYLPEFNLPKNSFDQLYIDLCELFKTNGGGWIGKDNANVIGKKFIIDLSKSIWYIDNCFFKTIDDSELQNFYKILINYLELPWMSKPKFSWFKVPLQIYVNNLLKYSNYLIEQKAITLKNQNSLAPIVDEGKAVYIEILNANTWRRCRFIEKLKNAFLFKHINNNANEEELVNKHYKIKNNLKQIIQIYHTRAMRKEFIDTVELCIGDPELITDLCEINKGRIFKYDLFWEYALKYLEGIVQESILAVDEKRHDIFQHLVVAISIRDFQNQVLKICPLNISTPSLQWIRLQFWPKNSIHKSSLQFTCKLPIKFMEMAILLRENSWLVFMDDKHQCKVVADYDFTKCDVIPSVTIICDISCTIDESFYKGQVYVGLKDSIIQPSDPLRHIAELYKILKHQDENKPYLLLYTDGGPDHRPLKSDEVDFFQVHSLPDPIPTIDKTSYKEFSEIYGTITTEQYQPSLKHQQKDKQTNKMGFSPNAQFAKNFGVVVECYESDTEVSNNNDDYESDNLSEIFEKVKINNSLTCNSPMEIPYYSSGLFEDICFQCGKIPEEGDEESNNQVNIEEGYYYYCNECYITVDSKKRRNRKVKLQQSKRRRTDA